MCERPTPNVTLADGDVWVIDETVIHNADGSATLAEYREFVMRADGTREELRHG